MSPYAFDVIFVNLSRFISYQLGYFCPRSRTFKKRFWNNFILSDGRILTWPTEERHLWQCGKLEKISKWDTHKEGSQRRIEHSSEDVTNRNRIGTRIGYQKILEILSAWNLPEAPHREEEISSAPFSMFECARFNDCNLLRRFGSFITNSCFYWRSVPTTQMLFSTTNVSEYVAR